MFENTMWWKKLAAMGLVLAAVFLLGFVPQYRNAKALQRDASSYQERLVSLQLKLKLADLRDLMGLIYLETNLKNYGLAQQHSTEFFTKARQMASETADPKVKAALQDILLQRDTLTAGLAEGQPAILTNLEDILKRLYEDTRVY